MTETRTAVLSKENLDIPGRLAVTYTIGSNGRVEKIQLGYKNVEREIDSYAISYERLGRSDSTGIVTHNTTLAFPELGGTADETWEQATSYYLAHGVLPYLKFTPHQQGSIMKKFVEPLSQAVRFLSEDTERLRSYPSRFYGIVRFEMSLAKDQVQMSDTIDIQLCDPNDEADDDA